MASKVSPKIVSVWQKAVEAFDDNRLEEAREQFRDIQDHSAKMSFNLATVDLLSKNYAAALENLNQCVQRDPYLAVAYFQRAITEYFLGRLENAQQDFAQAKLNIRNGEFIDYRQLGMPVKLTVEQVQQNQNTLEKIRLQNASRKIAEGDLITLPLETCIFRPAKSLVDNLEKKQFLPQSKVVSYITGYGIEESDRFKKPQPVLKSHSTPVSPETSRKVLPDKEITDIRGTRAWTPPPARPPPRVPPPSSSVTTVIHGKSNSNAFICSPTVKLQAQVSSGCVSVSQLNKGSNHKDGSSAQVKERYPPLSLPARESDVTSMIQKLNGSSVTDGKNQGHKPVSGSNGLSSRSLQKEPKGIERRPGPPTRLPPPRPDVSPSQAFARPKP